MAQVEIRNAIETRLAAFAATKSIPILWENVAAEPPSYTHFRVTLFPSPTSNPSLGAYHRRYKGIYRVQCWVNSLNTGPQESEALAEELVAYFPLGLQMTESGVTVHIEKTPSQSGIAIESNHNVVTVEMIYRADVITN